MGAREAKVMGARLAAGCPAAFPLQGRGGFEGMLSQSGKASGGEGRWTKKLRVTECGRTSLLVVSVNARAEVALAAEKAGLDRQEAAELPPPQFGMKFNSSHGLETNRVARCLPGSWNHNLVGKGL